MVSLWPGGPGKRRNTCILLGLDLVGAHESTISGSQLSIPSWLGLFLNCLLSEDDHLAPHYFRDSLIAILTASVWSAWSVAFLSFSTIIGSTVFLRLVYSVSFICLLGVAVVVME